MNWQPIDTAPTDGTPVLLGWVGSPGVQIGWYGPKRSYGGVNYSDEWGIGCDWLNDRFSPQPTHWQPLPEAPK